MVICINIVLIYEFVVVMKLIFHIIYYYTIILLVSVFTFSHCLWLLLEYRRKKERNVLEYRRKQKLNARKNIAISRESLSRVDQTSERDSEDLKVSKVPVSIINKIMNHIGIKLEKINWKGGQHLNI